jgi:hypothetical protein
MQLNGKQKTVMSMLDGLRTAKAEDSSQTINYGTMYSSGVYSDSTRERGRNNFG